MRQETTAKDVDSWREIVSNQRISIDNVPEFCKSFIQIIINILRYQEKTSQDTLILVGVIV